MNKTIPFNLYNNLQICFGASCKSKNTNQANRVITESWIHIFQCRLLKEELSKLSSRLKDKVVGDPRCPLIIIPTLTMA
jgi:hypothetical protein